LRSAFRLRFRPRLSNPSLRLAHNRAKSDI
jgi:hypothetical protein